MEIDFVFRDEDKRASLEPLYRAALDEFSLPKRTVCCIFDNEERPEFINRWGETYNGFHCAVKEWGTRQICWPPELVSDFTSTDSLGFTQIPDSVLYVRKRIADDPVGSVITFAHIVQHLVSMTTQRAFSRACQLLRLSGLPRANARPWELPDEYDAELTAKRVASAVLGSQRVTGHALAQLHVNRDAEKWDFFLSLDPAQPFDFPEQAKAVVALYRPQLEAWCRDNENGIAELDFTQDNWWKAREAQ